MAKKPTRWLPLFNDYLKHLRIRSKNESDPDGNGVPLKLYASQRMVLEQICDGLDNGIHVFYILKSRQLGVTTVTLAIMLFWLALHPSVIACLVADNDENMEAFRETIRFYVQSLSGYMGKSFSLDPLLGGKSNKAFFKFSNGSQLDLLVAGKNKKTWGESRGYVAGHLTEVAKYGKAEGLASFNETLSETNPNRLYIYESTAFGENHWKDYWEEGLRDPYTKRCIFVGWWSHDEQKIRQTDRRYQIYGAQPSTPRESELAGIVAQRYGHVISHEQLAWIRWRSSQKTAGAFDLDQNQPWIPEQAFVESGISFFDTRKVMQYRQSIVNAPQVPVKEGGFAFTPYTFHLGQDFHQGKINALPASAPPEQRLLRVWEEPVPGGRYAIGCDPAYGRTDWADKHAIEVWRCFADRMVQVAEYADHNVETRQCAWVLAMLAGLYENCMVNVDLAGGPGQVVMQEFQHLRERLRADLYQEVVKKHGLEDFLSAAQWYIYRKPDSPGPGFMYGTKTSHDIKFRMMNMMRDSWRSELLLIRSVPLLDEMMVCRQEGPDIGAAAQGRDKDDRVFATALANMTWIENIRQGMVAQGLTYDVETKSEAGQITPVSKVLNRRVYTLLRSAAEAETLPPPPTFFERRGLV